MTLADKIVTWLAYLISSKAEKAAHVHELQGHLNANQRLTEILEERLHEVLNAPLREKREEQANDMIANIDKLKESLKDLKENGDRLRDRIDCIQPFRFPKAQAKRTR